MNSKPNNVIRIPTNFKDFFKYWLMFLEPFHHLSNREIEVVAGFLKERYTLSKAVSDFNLLNKIVFNEDTKRKVRESCNLSQAHFQVILGKLRKNKVIIDGKINQKFIPNIVEDSGIFQLLFLFEIDGFQKDYSESSREAEST